MKIQMRLADFSSIVLVLVPILATTEINGMLLVEIYRNSMMVPVDTNELLRLISTRSTRVLVSSYWLFLNSMKKSWF